MIPPTEKNGSGGGPKTMLGRLFRRMVNDIRQKSLMPIKLLFFVQSSTLFVLYPFLTIHMKELGIGVEEAAAMNAITPVIAILMPPLAGMVADRIGNFRIQLSVLSAVGGAASLLLLLVPAARHRPDLLPSTLLVLEQQTFPSAQEGGGGFLTLRPASGHPCHFLNITSSTLSLIRCGHTCPSDGASSHSPYLKPSNFTNRSSMVPIHGDRVFLPDDLSVGLHCSPRCVIARRTTNSSWEDPLELDLSFLPSSESVDEAHVKVEEKGSRKNASKPNSPSESQAWIASGDGKRVKPCYAACLVTGSRKEICSNEDYYVVDNPQLTFWSYLSVRVLIGAIGGTAFAMFEGAVIALLRKHDADYGLQRMYAALGAMVASPLSGLLLDTASSAADGRTDFRPAFYLYAGLKIISGLLVLTIDLEFKAPAEHIIKSVMGALKNVELLAILGASLALGAAWGFLEGFLFWLLQDLGASRTLMGLTVTVGGAAGLPLLALAGPITDKIGHHAIIAISFIVYAVRLLGYSLLGNPWYCLVFEAMEGVTSSLATTAAVTAVASRSTTSTDSSLQGLLGGLYYGVGKGIGSLIGGMLMGAIGTRNTFRLFAGTCAVVGVVYLLLSRFVLSHPQKKEDNNKQTKDKKEAQT